MNTIVATDRWDVAADRLADAVEVMLRERQDIVCALEFDEAEAIAETLEAGRRPEVAARLMHRWALSEPDWDDRHGDIIRRWLAIDVGAARAA